MIRLLLNPSTLNSSNLDSLNSPQPFISSSSFYTPTSFKRIRPSLEDVRKRKARSSMFRWGKEVGSYQREIEEEGEFSL